MKAATPARARPAKSPAPVHVRSLKGVLRRQCACGGSHNHDSHDGECEGCRKKRLQRRAAAGTTNAVSAAGAAGQGAQAPGLVHDVLGSPGMPLDPATRDFMEPRFGHDFSAVRVHTDDRAAASARAVGALAYTVGSHVVFGAGRYRPEHRDGRQLLAHELAHTLQQRGVEALQPSLEIGRVDDPLEYEADRVADAALRGGPLPRVTPRSGPALRRRAAPEPQPLRTDVARVDAPGRGQGAHIHVVRRLMPCECRRVPDVREGVFWNPDLDAFAIAYRHCRGHTTTDVYAEVESNLSSFLTGGTPPTGTARVGFEVNVSGRNVGGRVQLEVLGSNEADRQGVGGRAEVVFQGGRWRVFLTTDFLHRLGATTGDDLTFNFGARIGPVTVEAQASDVLSPTPTGSGAACVDIFGGAARLCATLSGGGGQGITPGIGLRGHFGGPEVHEDECFQCLCPPPTKHFECFLDIPPVEREVTRNVEVEVPGEHIYYFRLDHTSPSEERTLRSQSRRHLDDVATEVNAGGQVTMITGYASPEGTERHNEGLSLRRAQKLLSLVRSRVPSGTTLPEPTAGGELLGRRPSPAPTSQLGDAIHAGGFRSAEDLSFFLLGEEIPRPQLADQFVSLFNALPEPADRLALFGLGPGDPLAPRVLGAVDAFLRRPHAGSRPWERIFRLLRIGTVRTSRPETRTVTETERTSGSLDTLPEDECREVGRRAERSGVLPPIPQSLRVPHHGREDRDVDCTIEVRPEDRRGGCSYALTPEMRRRPTAPERAPRAFP